MTTTETLTPRQQQALATKATIADAALELFSEQGYAATSTKQIAREAGVSEGLIFRYFPTKIALLRSIADEQKTLSGRVRRLLADAGDRPVTECLPLIAAGFASLQGSERQLLNVLLGESRSNDELYETFRSVVDETVGALAVYLGRRVDAGELRADLEVEGGARAFFGPIILFFLTHKHLSDDAWQTQCRNYTDSFLTVWFRGALRHP